MLLSSNLLCLFNISNLPNHQIHLVGYEAEPVDEAPGGQGVQGTGGYVGGGGGGEEKGD